jgi:hypothetical protein
MIKTFTLNAIEHDQDTPERGLIAWHITDENNRKRKVVAITQLSRQGFIKMVKPNHDREIPLVELLSYYVEGESFRVDFSMFNETFGYLARKPFPEADKNTTSGNWVKDNLNDLLHTTSSAK